MDVNEARRKQFEDAAEAAAQAWRPTSGSANAAAVYVNAEAKTGSRYAVVVTELPPTGADKEGGQWLVTVLQPWQTSYVVSFIEPLHLDYVLERFCRPGTRPELVHGGDARAMQATINMALGKFEEWTALARSAGQQGLEPSVFPDLR